MSASASDSEPQLDRARHIKYWKRCHGTFLPTAYTSNDSTRLTFAFFVISALDLLSVALTDKDRAAIRTWVLSLQHPGGGFCGSPTHAVPGKHAEKGSANLAATFFALLLLGLSAGGSDAEQSAAFAGVDRKRLLGWLRKMQRDDGSFGQVLWDGEPLGGRDMRHSYLASGIRWMLRGSAGKGEDGWEEDIDVDKMVSHIRGVQTCDGGISEASQLESHAGYAYCAIAALSLLDRAPSSTAQGLAMHQGITDRQGLLKFLAHRQIAYLSKEEEEDEGENFLESKLGALSLEDGCKHVGFNGRCNKKADTCYCWWVGGTLTLLETSALFDTKPSRNYILDITQHSIGGFSKAVFGLPDIYHSYLGLASLSMMGDTDLKEIDVGLCCSKETTHKIERARQGLLEALQRQREDDWGTEDFWGKTAQASKAS